MKETDLFPPLKTWLEERGYDVFAEVKSGRAGGRADIVAVAGPAVTVVEMKKSLTLDLMAQALRWKLYANYVYVAIPASQKRRMSQYVKSLMSREGIGLLEIIELENGTKHIQDQPRAKFNRRIDDHIRQSLLPQHKELPGGHAGGGYVTKYRLTIDRVKDFLKYYTRGNEGWASIKDILDHCETHYAQPKPSLSAALRQFEHDWCETKVEGGKLWYRMKGVAK